MSILSRCFKFLSRAKREDGSVKDEPRRDANKGQDGGPLSKSRRLPDGLRRAETASE